MGIKGKDKPLLEWEWECEGGDYSWFYRIIRSGVFLSEYYIIYIMSQYSNIFKYNKIMQLLLFNYLY